jgi:hypothetical protein
MNNQNEYQKSIAAWRESEHKSVGWFTRILKRIRQQKQTQSAGLELFRDQFEFETGLDSRGKGKQAFERAMQFHIQRAEQKREQREWRLLQGPLAEFDDLDGPMEDLGGNEEWANALIKANPALKKHRGNLT